MARTAGGVSAQPSDEAGAPAGRGHIGAIVLSSIVVGLGLGLILDLLVFDGSRETVITGLALLSCAAGSAMLAALSTRRTDQPQEWAWVSAAAFGVAGAAILVVGPSNHVLRLLGWVWPILLLLLVAWMLRGSRRSLHSWSRRAVLYPAFVVLALVAVGGVFETVFEATNSNSAPSGQVYRVNGHSLYLNCVGTRAPTVVLFNGFQERTPSWAWVQQRVALEARVCTFDRAGEGWSGPAPGRQDSHQLAADLHTLLATAHVPGPYVVAGHSVGGTYALDFAQQYPAQVAGVALIDSSTPYQFALPGYSSFYSTWRRFSALLPSMARAGLAHLTSRLEFAGLPSQARGSARAFASNPRELRADRNEFAELPTAFKQAQALTTLNGKPLVVLTADRGQQTGWFAAQDKLALLSTNAVHRTTHGATHIALLEDEKFASVTSAAIRDVVRSVRTTTPLVLP